MFLLAFIAVQVNVVQNWLVKFAASRLSADLGTEVSIRNVSFSLFNKLNMEGTLVKDKKQDTLLYAGALKVRITDWFFLKEKAELKYIGLEDAVIKLQRKDSVWNYQFISDYFASSKAKQKKAEGIDFDLKKVDLKNVSFLENDLWRGERMNIKVSSLLLDAEKINLTTKNFIIDELTIDNPYFYILNLPGLRPDSLIHHINPKADTGLKMNPGNMVLNIKKLQIKNGTVSILGNEHPFDNYFDGSHLVISKINGKFNNTVLLKDTLRSDVEINAKERS